MFEAYKIGVAIELTNHVSSGLTTVIRDLTKTEEQAASLQKRLESITFGMKAGLYAAGAGVAIAAAFKPAIDDALKFERAMLRLKDIGGIDVKVLAQVRGDALSGKYKGIGATESVDLVRDLHAAFGDAKEALEFMPLFAGMARVTQGKYGKSAVQGEEDVRALAKVAERRGGTTSAARMESALDLAMRIQNASGGAVTPKDLLAFMNRMGAMGNAMSNEGIMKMWALMQEQGGSKAGTALNSALQNLVNGRGTEGSGAVLRKIGWVDEEKNIQGLKSLYGDSWEKHRNKVTANALKNSDQIKEDAPGWMESTGLPLIQKYLDKQHITDPKKRDAEAISLLAQGLSNRFGADSMALIATQLPRILKDFHIAQKSAGLRDSIKSYDESPMAKLQQLHTRFETVMVNLGEAALPVVVPLFNRLAAAFKSFNEYAQANPGKLKAITAGILSLSVALVALGTATFVVNGVRALGLVFQVLNVGRVVSIFKGLASITMTAGRVIGTFLVGGLRLAGQAVLFLGRALLTNPIGLIITAIAGAVYLLWKNWDTVGPKLKSAWESIKSSVATLCDWLRSKWEWIKSFLPSSWFSPTKPDPIVKAPATTIRGAAPVSPVIPSVLSVQQKSETYNFSMAREKSVVPPPPPAPAFKIENKFDAHGISTRITQQMGASMARPPTGPNFVDGSMSPVPVAFGGR